MDKMTNDTQMRSPSLNDDDDWDPMREEYENPQINCYDFGPGANLDINIQRPTHRDANNEVVYKVMIHRIPLGLSKVGLLNLLSNFGSPNITKFSDENRWALVSFKRMKTNMKCPVNLLNPASSCVPGQCNVFVVAALSEATETLRALNATPPFNMSLKFARSDEENERLKREKEEGERRYQEWSKSAVRNDIPQPASPIPGTSLSSKARQSLRALGRGNRGRFIMNAFRQNNERRAGLKNCAWSNGIPDFRDPGGLMYDPRSNRHNASNKYLQSIVVTTSGNSARKVTMGRGFVPPERQENSSPEVIFEKRFGNEVQVALLPCKKCSSNTAQKCSRCGTPYCSRECQKADYFRHKSECHPKESIDFIESSSSPSSQNYTHIPLSSTTNQSINAVRSTVPIQKSNSLWGRPNECVLSRLQSGTEAIFTPSKSNPGHGALSCKEVFEEMQTVMNLNNLQFRREDFWPVPGTLVAVTHENCRWRGCILSTPVIGYSTIFTVALCDAGTVSKIDAKDIFRLPSVFQTIPEMAVSCDVVEAAPQFQIFMAREESWSLKVINSSNSKASAQVVSDNGDIIAHVILSKWEPLVGRELMTVQMTPPCQVVLSSYHHQHAIYVRPVGRSYQDQMFNLLQKVAAVMVTSPPLDRAPRKDEMVACKFGDDGNYYRALVHEAKSDVEYVVHYVDFGNVGCAKVKDMKALPYDLKETPCMAVRVSLKGVSQGPLTEDATQWLNMLLQKEQQFRLECIALNAEGVELFFPDGGSFNAQLEEYLLPEWKLSMKKGQEPHKGEVFLLGNMKVLPLLKDGLKSGRTHVVVTHVMPNGQVCVCPDRLEIEHVLETLSFQINEYCESTDPYSSYNPRESEVFLAKYKDGMWYRAMNFKTKTETQSCEALFLDFGNVEDVEFKNIRRMVPDFTSSPTIMSMCSLDGVPDNPAPDVVQRIIALVPTNKLVEIEVIAEIGLGEYKILIPEVSNQLKSELSR